MADQFIQDAARMAGRGAISGMSAVGNVMDLPGSMVRDVLTLNNPLDQLLSPTSDKNRVSGRDLLRKYKLVNKKKDTWGNWAAGLGVEMATDPLTYVGLPGISKASSTGGELLKMAGHTTDDIVRVATKRAGKTVAQSKTLGTLDSMKTTLRNMLDDAASHSTEKHTELLQNLTNAATAKKVDLNKVLDEPLGALMQAQIPFMPGTKTLIGKAGQPWAEKTASFVDNVWDKARFNPVSNAIAPLFLKGVNGATKKVSQIRGVRETANEADLLAKTRGDIYDMIVAADDTGAFKGPDAVKNSNAITQYLEEAGNWQSLPQTNAAVGKMQPHLDKAKQMISDSLSSERRSGMKTPELSDQMEGILKYFPRNKNHVNQSLTSFADQAKGKGLAYSTHNPSYIQRDKTLTKLPAGTEALQRMSLDSKLSGIARTLPAGKIPRRVINANAKHIIQNYPEAVPDISSTAAASALFSKGIASPTATQIAAQQAKMKLKQIKEIVVHMGYLPAEHVAEGRPMFRVNKFEDLAHRLENGIRSSKNMKHALGIMEETAIPRSQAAFGDVSLAKMLRQPGVDTAHAALEMYGRLQKHPTLGSTLPALTGVPAADLKFARKMMRQLYIPKEYADEVGRQVKKFQAPEAVSNILQQSDRVTRLFKAAVTSPFPAFAARNRASGMGQNVLGGMGDAQSNPLMSYIKPANNAEGMLAGDLAKGASEMPFAKNAGLDDAGATNAIKKMAFQHSWIGSGQGKMLEDVTDPLGQYASEIPGLRKSQYDFRTPGSAVKSVGKFLYNWIPKSGAQANPLNVQGVGSNTDINSMIAAGRGLGGHGEQINRMSGGLGLLSQGYSPKAIGQQIKKYHVDYGNLTDFEKNVVRRVLPFYSFTKGITSQVASDLAQNPGGRLRNTIRTTNSLKGDDPTTPDYVADTLAIPLGEQQDGTKRYLTGFGMAHEDPLSFAGGGARGAGLEAMSRLNPLIKAPLEYFTGQTFFQKGAEGGRSLRDADPTLGRLMANISGRKDAVRYPGEQAVEVGLSNSPLTRVLSTARQLSDPRKGALAKAVNTLTGVRVSDISPGAQDAVLRDKMEAIMRQYPEARSYTKTFISKDEMASMDPERKKKLQSMMTMMNELSDRASKRAAVKKALEASKQKKS